MTEYLPLERGHHTVMRGSILSLKGLGREKTEGMVRAEAGMPMCGSPGVLVREVGIGGAVRRMPDIGTSGLPWEEGRELQS
jgi:hypothetical protein